ncbi:MAG: Gfo/Idh/MocA family oxidoreductase [Lentisphaeria bacterium]|nr:Gfo/Idh/MocA family oxidoreductase [Lentisphaeria bacterium]MBQ7393373.1 Gfo/Idh/MocA family oxidoreductase [Lentisphaeria bacterium]
MMKDKLNSINVVAVGVSGRGKGMLRRLLPMEDVNIVGISDLYEDRMEEAAALVEEARGVKPVLKRDYRELLEMDGVDAVMTAASWTAHARICLDAMNAGKYVGTEVGGATSIEECWELVRTSERTGMPCMMLENCCYGRPEMAVLNMISKGMFGELIHAEGGYRHDLRDEVCMGRENRHYRLANYLNRTGDVYPTHELGPIAKYLGINRGNRMVSLSSMASKARGAAAWVAQHKPDDEYLKGREFALGDIVVTNIKCAHGEVITLYHDTTLPRPYSRGNLLQGTKGIWMEDKQGVYFDGVSPKPHEWESIEKYYKRYDHPLWKKYIREGVKEGHGGMDHLVLRGFVNAVKKQIQTPIDVYDTASWMAITTLSEDSVNMGGLPVAIPDFTNGRWIEREPSPDTPFNLDRVCRAAYL